MKQLIGKLKFNRVIFPDLSEEQLNYLTLKAQEGVTDAKLDLIIHNQGVLSEKMNKLLKRKGVKK